VFSVWILRYCQFRNNIAVIA